MLRVEIETKSMKIRYPLSKALYQYPFLLLVSANLSTSYYCKKIQANYYHNYSPSFNHKKYMNNNNMDSADIKSELAHNHWSEMWDKGIQPGEAFDALKPSPLLIKYLHENKIPNGRALVPGCGRGYDVTALASKDRYVLGLDIAEQALVAAKNRMNSLTSEECLDKSNIEFSTTSFFELAYQNIEERFDFIYDYTFLCALHPSVRNIWASKMAEVIKPGGLLLCLIFPIRPMDEKGPPYAVSLDIVKNLLEPNGFKCLELERLPSELCHEGRDGTSSKYNAYSGVGMFKKI